jgi:phospholipid transport system substrate-binding protein
MKMLTKLFAIAALAVPALSLGRRVRPGSPGCAGQAHQPEVMDTAKNDKDIQAGNNARIMQLVEQKILPYVDFQRMTQLAAGRYWREATPEQQKQLITQFRSLLVFTYSGALSQVRDQKIEFKPLRAAPPIPKWK